MGKQKLELTWIGKDKRARLEPRILLEDPKKSYHAKVRHGDGDIFDNMLIKGDNLLALNLADFPNLTVKKIPRAILKKCEWNKDDYSLQIQNLPMAEDESQTEEGGRQMDLF